MSTPSVNNAVPRREALKQLACLMGGALSTPVILGMLNGCSPKPGVAWKPAFLTEQQGALLAEVAEIMIPRTDTPGAKDIGISAFIDTMLKDAYPAEDQKRYLAGLTAFEEQSQHEYGRAFLKLEQPQQAALVQSVHDIATAAEQPQRTRPTKVERPFILMTKELALLGYFSSEVGATQVLQYLPVPGAFHGCIPLSQAGNGKTWATEMSSKF